MMKMEISPQVFRFLEVMLLILLIVTPFLPWYMGYLDGDLIGISFWEMLAADAIDAVGNLTYDQMTFTQVLQVGYLTSAIIQMIWLICNWGYAIAHLGEITLAGRMNRMMIGNILLCGSVIYVVIVGTLNYRELGWGYWASGVILASATGLRLCPSLRQRAHSMPSLAG
ncbi:MAG: hypothetical protein JXA33_23355 [Anaerolineae bacterium]|nr:hypothetical protein [Anaerolineae bacterium]